MTENAHAGLPTVSVVIPAFNEEENIDEVIDRSLTVLAKVASAYEVVVVDDDSTDSTPALVQRHTDRGEPVRLILAGANIGANAAALLGMRNAQYDLCFFIPADLQILPDQLMRCLPSLQRADYVCTYRRPRADRWHRKAMARAYNFAVRTMFHLGTHDVDSTILVRREVIEAIAPSLTSSSDFLPVEMLVRAQSQGYRIAEVVIKHHPRVAGTPAAITPREVARTLMDLSRSLLRLRRLQRANVGRRP